MLTPNKTAPLASHHQVLTPTNSWLCLLSETKRPSPRRDIGSSQPRSLEQIARSGLHTASGGLTEVFQHHLGNWMSCWDNAALQIVVLDWLLDISSSSITFLIGLPVYLSGTARKVPFEDRHEKGLKRNMYGAEPLTCRLTKPHYTTADPPGWPVGYIKGQTRHVHSPLECPSHCTLCIC